MICQYIPVLFLYFAAVFTGAYCCSCGCGGGGGGGQASGERFDDGGWNTPALSSQVPLDPLFNQNYYQPPAPVIAPPPTCYQQAPPPCIQPLLPAPPPCARKPAICISNQKARLLQQKIQELKRKLLGSRGSCPCGCGAPSPRTCLQSKLFVKPPTCGYYY